MAWEVRAGLQKATLCLENYTQELTWGASYFHSPTGQTYRDLAHELKTFISIYSGADLGGGCRGSAKSPKLLGKWKHPWTDR